jgi:bifunctional DNase/RNase
MKKIELKVLGLSYSHTQAGSYVLVLAERKGKIKLPIIIKPGDAQYIALKIENIESPKPLIHNLFFKMNQLAGFDLQQILISHIVEGVFFTKLIFTSATEEFELECAIGDAICLALAHACPIYCSKDVLNISGIEISDDGVMTEEQADRNKKDREYKATPSIENLEKMLNKAIENEEYEIASQLRDRITELKRG